MSRRNSRISIADLLQKDDSKSKTTDMLTDINICKSSQKIVEMLAYLYSQHRDIYDNSKAVFQDNLVTKKFSKLGDSMELINYHRNLLNQCQMLLSSCLFFQFTVETMSSLWQMSISSKSEAKVIVKNNKSQNSDYINMNNHLQNLKTRKEILIDDVEYYKNFWNLQKNGEDENEIQFENEIWNILTMVHSDASIPPSLYDIDKFLCEETTNEVMEVIKNYLSEGRVDENIGSVILLIGKRCINLDSLKVGLEVVTAARDILEKHCSKTSMKFNILSLPEAFILARQTKFPEAIKLLREVLTNIPAIQKSLINEVTYLKFQLGYFMVKWKETKEGMVLLEETANFYERNMDTMEIMWRMNMNTIATLYNDQNRCDLAYNCAEMVIRKYHEELFGPITVKNKTICDIASDIVSKSSASSLLLGTVTANQGVLPPFVLCSIGEVVIAFATKRNFHAVKLVEKYMNDCIEAHKVSDIAVKPDDLSSHIDKVQVSAKLSLNPFNKLKNVIKK